MERTQTQPSPETIFQHLNAYQRSAALKGAIALDVFTAIADGATTAKAIAERCRASERGIRILADYLTIMGLLTKQKSAYALTQDAATLRNRHSPAYLGTGTQSLFLG